MIKAIYTVWVVCENQEQADQVMGERLGPEEDYGFEYQLDYEHSQTDDQTFYIHMHEVWQEKGGPEEGGWWYDAGKPVESWHVLKFDDENTATLICRTLNEQEHKRRETEPHPYHSVLSGQSTFYQYSVEEYPTPRPFPSDRPHYE